MIFERPSRGSPKAFRGLFEGFSRASAKEAILAGLRGREEERRLGNIMAIYLRLKLPFQSLNPFKPLYFYIPLYTYYLPSYHRLRYLIYY